MNWTIGELKSGDLIRVRRTFYYHFGIYIGNEKVIHFAGVNSDGITDPKSIEVRVAVLEMFANNTVVEKAAYSLKERMFLKRSNKQIVALAYSRLGEQGYNFLRNNCEDFAYSCVFKKKMRTQIDHYKDEVKDLLK